MNVVKNDGSIQMFDYSKIERAVTKAFASVEAPLDEKFMEQLKSQIDKALSNHTSDGQIAVEELQDIIQKELIKRNKYDVVESFILYRKKRQEIRESKSELIKNVKKALNASDVQNQNANVDEASFGGRMGEATRVVTKDMALKSMSKMARRNHENNEIYIHDLDSYTAGMHNCLSIPFDTLLKNGFNTRQTDVRPANSVNTAFQLVAVIFQLQSLQQFGGVAATHIDWTMVPYVRKSFIKHYNDVRNTMSLKPIQKDEDFVVNTEIDSEEYKGKWYQPMKRYVWNKAINRTYKEIRQAVEGMYHNLNTLQSRSGNQLPFTSINYGTCTNMSGRMVTKALLEVSMEGLGRYHKTSIFPCGIFQYMKGVNDKKGTPNYDLFRLALKSTAKRIYPNYANVDWSNQQDWLLADRNAKKEYLLSLGKKEYNKLVENIEKNPKVVMDKMGLSVIGKTVVVDMTERPTEMFSTMGCRTVNGLNVNAMDNFKNNVKCVIEGRYDEIDDVFSSSQKDGRGNLCPVTIILPTLAMQSKEKVEKKASKEEREYSQEEVVEEFMKLLDKKIYEAKDMLLERYEHMCSQSPASAKFMWENNTMSGYHPEEGIRSALKQGTLTIGQIAIAETLQILLGCDHTEEKGMELAKRIEALYGKRCAEFKKEYKLNFGVYYTPAENLCYTSMKKFRARYGTIKNVSDREYFTNSIHVPVWHDLDPFEKIDIESQLTTYSNAGCITYVELPSTAINNIDAIETIVNYAMEKDIPYFAMNFPLDCCNKCHAQGDFNGVCPECGSTDIDELRRVTGYLSTTKKHFNYGKQKETDDRVKHIKN